MMIKYNDQNPARDIHTESCWGWCNHCSLCGNAILYGARCKAHEGIYPERAMVN